MVDFFVCEKIILKERIVSVIKYFNKFYYMNIKN